MKKENQPKDNIRQKAEDLLQNKPSKASALKSEFDTLKLIHELEVHQIELELQNEELLLARSTTIEALDNYTQLYDFAPTGNFTLSTEGEIFELNLIGAKMLGKERLQLINSQFGFFISNNSKSIFQLFLKKVFKSLGKESCEISLSTNKNKAEYFHLTGIANKNKDKCFITAVDITERITAEKALKESEELHRITLENINDPVFITKDDGTFTFICPNVEKNLGYTVEEIAGMGKIAELLGENLFDRNELDSRKILENIEYTLSDKNGKQHHFLVSVKRVSIQGGTILYVCHDITERKFAERELKKSKKRFEELVDLLPEAVFEIDMNLNLTYVNKRALDLFAYSQEEVSAGLNAMEMIVPEQREQALSNFAKRLKGEEPGTVEYRAIKKNGSVFPILFHASSIIEDGKLLGARGVIIDISESKKAEKDLKDNKELFSLFMHYSPVYTFIKEVTSTESRVIQASNNFKDMIGISGANMVGKTMEELFPTEFAAKISADDWNVVKEGKVLQLDENLNDKHYTTIKFPIDKGDKKLLAGYTIDITERKHAEDLLNDIIEKNPMSIQIVDKEGHILHGNPAYFKLFGAIPPPDFSIFDDLQNKSKKLEELIKLAKSGEVVHLPDIYFNPRDEVAEAPDNPLWIRALIFPLNNSSGNPERFVFMHENITESKIAEQELIKAKEKAEATEIQLLTILENSPTGFAINKISTGKVTYVNKTFAEIYHIPIELCQSVTSFFEYVYGDQMELGNRIIEDLQSRDPERMKWEMVPITDKTTKKVHFVSAANIILKDLDLMISSVWDITSQVENEEKLISALNKATESDRLKSAFLANMSHEIRTPMNGILGFAELLKEPNLTGEQQQKYIAIIEKSGERMLNTINDIIDISKIEAGQIDVHISKINISEQLGTLNSFFKPEADKKGIQLLLKNQLVGDDAIINSDKNKLNSILINLLKNALKFCDKGTIEFGCILKGKILELYIKDTGKGIPDERQQAIFDRFIQADIEDKEAKQGSGLGLAISKSYVEMLGGKIWVESKPGKGSTFYFTIPYNPVKKQKNEITDIESFDELKKEDIQLKILIVEDDPESEMLIRLLIKDFSKEILKVKNGVDAIEICEKVPDIDLILMDKRIPGIDGYKATQRIREFNKRVVIIAQTAFALSGDREKALEAGCNDYISKPLNRSELNRLIKKYF